MAKEIIVLVVAGILLLWGCVVLAGMQYNRHETEQEQKSRAEFVKAADALLSEEEVCTD